MASSMVAEATEASVLDSVQDGASSIDDGGSMDGASARCAAFVCAATCNDATQQPWSALAMA